MEDHPMQSATIVKPTTTASKANQDGSTSGNNQNRKVFVPAPVEEAPQGRQVVTRGTPESFDESIKRVKAKLEATRKALEVGSKYLLTELANAVNKAVCEAKKKCSQEALDHYGLMLNVRVKFRKWSFKAVLFPGEHVTHESVLFVLNERDLHDAMSEIANGETTKWLHVTVENNRLVFKRDLGRKLGEEVASFDAPRHVVLAATYK
jgi:hypothetical protein